MQDIKLSEVSSVQCEGFADVKQDTQADCPVNNDLGGFPKIMIGDDTLPYLSEISGDLVDTLVDFSVSCAVCG